MNAVSERDCWLAASRAVAPHRLWAFAGTHDPKALAPEFVGSSHLRDGSDLMWEANRKRLLLWPRSELRDGPGSRAVTWRTVACWASAGLADRAAHAALERGIRVWSAYCRSNWEAWPHRGFPRYPRTAERRLRAYSGASRVLRDGARAVWAAGEPSDIGQLDLFFEEATA